MSDDAAQAVRTTDAPPPQEVARDRIGGGFFARLSSLGATAQSAIPALYAWGVTVAPCAWARGAGVLPKIVSVLAIAFVAGAIVLERTRPLVARLVLLWGFAGASVLTWALAPQGVSPAKLDSARAFLGVVGWLMVAFSAAAPPLRRAADGGRIVAGSKLKPRGRVARGDAFFLIGAFVCALALQAIGWGVTAPERALLVRAVTLVAGVAVIGAATDVATARHLPRKPARPRARLLRAWPAGALLVVLALGGLGYVLLRTAP